MPTPATARKAKPKRTIIGDLLHGVTTNKLTNRLAVPFLVSAAVQVLFTFDSNPETVTDWGEAGKMLLMGFGLLATPGTDKTPEA